jgi:hypothetical protein
MIYTAPCILFWMRAYPLLGQVGRGWGLKSWQCGMKILLGRKVFLSHCQRNPPSPSHIGLSPSTPPPLHLPPLLFSLSNWAPSPHLELIRNQQQSVRCIKGRSGSVHKTSSCPVQHIKQSKCIKLTIDTNILYNLRCTKLYISQKNHRKL